MKPQQDALFDFMTPRPRTTSSAPAAPAPPPPPPPVVDTLQQERARLALVRADCTTSSHCRACGLFIKTYKERLHSTMARALIQMVKQYERGNDWIHVPRLEKSMESVKSPCLTQLGRWQLIEKHPGKEVDPARKSSGLWRPTELGIDFVYGRVRIPGHVFVTDGKILARSIEEIDIWQALRKKFNYQELMDGS